MRVLPKVKPTPEQLPIILENKPGTLLIRGAAGSGKTTTVLLRLKTLAARWHSRRERLQLDDPVRILVLTYNRTLRGYISELARNEIIETENLELQVLTFSKWAHNALKNPSMITDAPDRIKKLGRTISLPEDFLVDEVEYLLGRFLPSELKNYLSCRRDGRGIAPRVERPLRKKIISEVILPYNKWKKSKGVKDWNDLAVDLATQKKTPSYDIIIIDEAQDFSANQIRAVQNQLNTDHSLTIVTDAVQRIYPKGFTSWAEVGLTCETHRLEKNYRNTKQISCFARSILKGMKVDDDGTLPDFKRCSRDGPVPVVLKGGFSSQARFVIKHIKDKINLKKQSVAFLHPMGGGWFGTLKEELNKARLDFVCITRKSDWPAGRENIALSTLHSAKGLEFDHVIILGLNQKITPHGDDEGDDQLDRLRRLFAMAIGRAKHSVIVGYKPEDASSLIKYFSKDTYELVNL